MTTGFCFAAIEDESIVAVRTGRTEADKFAPLSGEETVKLQGVFLVRTPTLCPILDVEWFLKKIEECEDNMGKWRSKQLQTAE